jgi:GABA(A) receptor-associated protein
MINHFKNTHDIESRKSASNRVLNKYPDRIPIIVQPVPNTDVPDIDKKKYLVPKDITVAQFIYIIRKRIKITPEKALFIFVNNVLPKNSSTILDIYKNHHDNTDLFLYIFYNTENTFGRNRYIAISEIYKLYVKYYGDHD